MPTLTRSLAVLAALCASAGAMAADDLTVTTDVRFARGATQAFFRATFPDASAVGECGFCWSKTSAEPTVADSRTTSYIAHAGRIYWAKDLEPATLYYARAYAIAADGTPCYGETIKFATLPRGSVSWSYDNGADAAANQRINTAVGRAVDYWNDLTSIHGLHLSVHYGATTPTADCSYGGWMRIGPSAAYQAVGTVMHESLHAIGVGTHAMWTPSASPLRNAATGEWRGDRATELLRFWDNSATATLHGDAMHLWPYGINGAQEDTGAASLYIATSLMAQALGEDGLPCTEAVGYALPCYSFVHDDAERYYLKSESASHGLYDSYLVETADHQLRWQAMTAAEATASDAAAWQVSFTPSTQLYRLRNAATGRYVTYTAGAAAGFATAEGATAASDLHLMRSRTDVAGRGGGIVTTQRAYWLIHPEAYTATPACLSAAEGGATGAAPFSIADGAVRQRWLLLTARQAREMEDSGLAEARAAYAATRAEVAGLEAVPAIELTEGAGATLATTLAAIEAQARAAASATDVMDCTARLLAAARAYLAGVCVADVDRPFDLTMLLANADFASGTADGWSPTAGYACSEGCVEYYQRSAIVTQTLSGMPAGTYRAQVSAFQRPGANADVYAAYMGGTDAVNARLYLTARSKYTLLRNVMAGRSDRSLHSGDRRLPDGTYVPDDMASAAAHFAAGRYVNTTEQYLAKPGDLSLGIFATGNTGAGFWTIFTGFRLYYLGAATREAIDEAIALGLAGVQAGPEPGAGRIFTLTGQPVDGPLSALPAGLYVVGGRKVAVRP